MVSLQVSYRTTTSISISIIPHSSDSPDSNRPHDHLLGSRSSLGVDSKLCRPTHPADPSPSPLPSLLHGRTGGGGGGRYPCCDRVSSTNAPQTSIADVHCRCPLLLVRLQGYRPPSEEAETAQEGRRRRSRSRNGAVKARLMEYAVLSQTFPLRQGHRHLTRHDHQLTTKKTVI